MSAPKRTESYESLPRICMDPAARFAQLDWDKLAAAGPAEKAAAKNDMNEPTRKLPPTLTPEALELLARIESVPLAECKAAYDNFDNREHGDTMGVMRACARHRKTTVAVISAFGGMEFPVRFSAQFCDFIKCIEFMVRDEKWRST